MINSAELGRKMMAYAARIDDDAEFNNWTRLAPHLIGLGTATHPRSLAELSAADQQLVKRAIAFLTDRGEITA